MQGARVPQPWLTAALLFFSLIRANSAVTPRQLYIVRGPRVDGIYQQKEQGSKVYYVKMGAVSNRRLHPILYRSTDSSITWLIGFGNLSDIEGRDDFFRASGTEPPSTGWTRIASGRKEKEISVTEVRLQRATEQQMFEGKGADT